MRLSDERLREIIDPGTGMSTDEEVALAAEVRALRECEKALEHLFERFHVSGDESGPSIGDVIAVQRAEAALAAVRALEDKP